VKVGDGLDPSNQMGPLANHRRIETMEAMIAMPARRRARAGRRKPHRQSRLLFPLTVLADLPDDARAMYDEPFGPLALVNPVNPWTRRSRRPIRSLCACRLRLHKVGAQRDRLADGVEAGNLSINNFVASIAETPFGGVKDSGYGREGGTEGCRITRL